MLAEAQRVDASARNLRPPTSRPAAPRPTGPPPPGPASRPTAPGGPAGVIGLLKRWTTSPSVERLAPAVPGPTPQAVAAATRARQAFEAAYKLACEVLAYVSPRLTVLRVALEATGRPGPARPMDEVKRTLHASGVAAGVAAPQMAFLPPLVKLFYADDTAVRRVHPALVQWQGVQATTAEAEVLRGALRSVEGDRGEALVQAFETGKYRAAIYPLTHLHLSFKGVPLVSELFPVPADVGAGK